MKPVVIVLLFFVILLPALLCVTNSKEFDINSVSVRAGNVEGLAICATDSLVILSWFQYPGASSYKVYSSAYPDSGFTLDTSGNFDGECWSSSRNENRRFFYVTAETASLPPDFIHVQGGTFHPSSEYIVTVSSFSICKYEVTQSSYFDVMNVNPSNFAGNPDFPVEKVTWYDTIVYCNRRSVLEGLTPCYSYGNSGTDPSSWPTGWNEGYVNHTNISCDWTASGYRLPTEMEWMYAAMGGNQTNGYVYSGANILNNFGWFSGTAQSTSHSVGTKNPNELGLFDMSGNVAEWCWDIFVAYPAGSYENPAGASSGNARTKRGGGWSSSLTECKVAERMSNLPNSKSNNLGFRVVCR